MADLAGWLAGWLASGAECAPWKIAKIEMNGANVEKIEQHKSRKKEMKLMSVHENTWNHRECADTRQMHNNAVVKARDGRCSHHKPQSVRFTSRAKPWLCCNQVNLTQCGYLKCQRLQIMLHMYTTPVYACVCEYVCMYVFAHHLFTYLTAMRRSTLS